MQSKRNYRGLKKYDSLLQVICRTEGQDVFEAKEWENYLGIQGLSSQMKNNYDNLMEKEWEGCLGVACVISVIEGVLPTIFALSKHLEVPHYNKNLQNAFDRLKVNGVFSNKFNLKKDLLLTGCGQKKGSRTAAERERSAWCNIAGIAGGFAGLKEEIKTKERTKKDEQDKNKDKK
jgi:hypothetical protein